MARYYCEFLMFRQRERRMIPPRNRMKWEIEGNDIASAMQDACGDEEREKVLLQLFADRTVWARREPSWHCSPPALIRKKGEDWKKYLDRCERTEWEYVLQNGGEYAR